MGTTFHFDFYDSVGKSGLKPGGLAAPSFLLTTVAVFFCLKGTGPGEYTLTTAPRVFEYDNIDIVDSIKLLVKPVTSPLSPKVSQVHVESLSSGLDGRGLRIMLHEAKDRQKFVSDVQYLRDMQHKVNSEYQDPPRRNNISIKNNKKKAFTLTNKEINSPGVSGDSPRVGPHIVLAPGPCAAEAGHTRTHCFWLPKAPPWEADPYSIHHIHHPFCSCISSSGPEPSQQHLIVIEDLSPVDLYEPVGSPADSRPEPGQSPPSYVPGKRIWMESGDSSEHPLFCVEYSPYCSVFAFSAFSPVFQPNTNCCCLPLPLVPPAPPAAQDSSPYLPPVSFPSFLSPTASSPGPMPESPAALCYFPISCPSPAETPVLCLPGPRRPSKIYLVCLLQEDSDEEGDLCRICQIAGGSPNNPLLEPCGCVGSLQFVHLECLKQWLKVKITSGADLSTVKTCEMCKQDLLVDLDDFNMTEFYQKHQQSRAQHELMNTGLYLVLLLRLYQRRFAELVRLNDNRAARERPVTKSLFSQGKSTSLLHRSPHPHSLAQWAPTEYTVFLIVA
ncbi:hypothetical protein CB1_000313015 [Camelus ferus]|nr:hypothetical protein CB1_000313015 [Camelus ferus]